MWWWPNYQESWSYQIAVDTRALKRCSGLHRKKWHQFSFPVGVHMRATFGFKFHANLCKLPQFLASGKQRFFHIEEAEKLTFQTIPNLPWFIPKFVRNRCFREWLHLCGVENQSSESSFASKGCLPKRFEISFCGTYLKVGIKEQSYWFFFLRTLLSENIIHIFVWYAPQAVWLYVRRKFTHDSVLEQWWKPGRQLRSR